MMRPMIDGTTTGPFGVADLSVLARAPGIDVQVCADLQLELEDRLPGFKVRVGRLEWVDGAFKDHWVLVAVSGEEHPPIGVVIDTLEMIEPESLRIRDGRDGSWSEWKYEEKV